MVNTQSAYSHSLSYCLSNGYCHFRCMSKYSPSNDEVVFFHTHSKYYVPIQEQAQKSEEQAKEMNKQMGQLAAIKQLTEVHISYCSYIHV